MLRFLLLAAAAASLLCADAIVYIGTYTQKASKGIYAFRMKSSTGELAPLGLVAETKNPSYVVLHPNGKFLFSVNEHGDDQGSGRITAYLIDRGSGKLTELNSVLSRGAAPCHLSLDRTGKFLFVANYSSGNVASFAIASDGRLSGPISNIQHQGSGPNRQRQREPHAHSINISKNNRWAVAADLGIDQLLVYRLGADGSLSAATPPSTKLKPGAGPRHFAFHPSQKFAFAINELDSTLTSLRFDAAQGSLTTIETVSTLPNGFSGNNSTAEVVVHPNGRFVYGSNRGHHSIAIFRLDPKSGKLTPAGHVATEGRTPRNFNIDPSGQFLLAANQDSDSVVVFRIDRATGALTPTGQKLDVSMPVCVKFLSVK